MGTNDLDEVRKLQSALRTCSKNCHMWESLADAYFKRGSYESASGAYKRALMFKADPVYPKLKIGTIHRRLGEEQEAINVLESLLKDNGTYIPALVECANTYYQIAKKYVADKLDIAGLVAIESCLKYCVVALEQDRRQVLPWKIIGDCTTLTTNFSSQLTVRVASKLIGLDSGEAITSVNMEQFLNIGTHCFYMALGVCEELGFGRETKAGLHNDIAYSFYITSLKTKDVGMLKRAMKEVKKAVSLKSSSHLYWNTLGIIASHSALDLGYLAQHSFIKSLELEANNAVTWCNLGFLYLKFGEPNLAHGCFSKAQSIEPRYAYAWMGQALVAQELKPVEAMDLFRHACSLENFPTLAALGYTDWVCRQLATGDEKTEQYIYNIGHLAAVQTSYDLMGFYCARHPEDARGFNLRGVISGRLGFLNTARACFENSLNLLDNSTDSTSKEFIRCNQAAVKLGQGESQTAIDDLKLVNKTDFTYYAIAAQAFYNVGEFEKSVEAYKEAEAVAPDNDKKSDALLGLGLVLGNMNGLESAKIPLLKSHELNKNKIGGLLALIALALQQETFSSEDLELAKLAYNNLNTIHEDEFLDDVATIKSLYLFVLSNGQEKVARHCLMRYVHMFPTNTALWRTLSHHLFQYCTGENYVTKFVKKYGKSSNDSGSSSEKLLAVKCIREGDYTQASVHAKKACHCWPEDPSHWIILIVALYEGIRSSKSKSTLKSTLQTTIRLAQKGIHFCAKDPSSEIGAWMVNYIDHFTQICSTLN